MEQGRMTTTTVRLYREQRDALNLLSERLGVSSSDFIRSAVVKALRELAEEDPSVRELLLKIEDDKVRESREITRGRLGITSDD